MPGRGGAFWTGWGTGPASTTPSTNCEFSPAGRRQRHKKTIRPQTNVQNGFSFISIALFCFFYCSFKKKKKIFCPNLHNISKNAKQTQPHITLETVCAIFVYNLSNHKYFHNYWDWIGLTTFLHTPSSFHTGAVKHPSCPTVKLSTLNF